MTPEEIKKFWIACGWRVAATTFPPGFELSDPAGEQQAWRATEVELWESRVVDHSDLNAVFEGLEWRLKQFTSDHQRRWSVMHAAAGGYAFQLAWSWNGTGLTLQEAIMRAVLAAQPTDRKETLL